jgi:class I lanthipeptide synthase
VPGHPQPAADPATCAGARAAAALATAAAVAARVADPVRVGELAAAAARQTAHPASVHWRDHAVGQGHAGLALLFGALDHRLPGEGWDETAHRHLELAVRSCEGQARLPAGLFAGLSGIGLVAACLSAGGSRYRRLLATVDRVLVPRAIALAGGSTGTPLGPERTGGVVRLFDLISGLTGIGAYLLLRRSRPGPAAGLAAVLDGLVDLTVQDGGAPRWGTPAGLLPPEERARFPGGNLNCGLAHGIPGPLALLALALRDGVEVAGLPEAVARTADWLAAHRADDRFGPNWPQAIPLDRAAAPPGPARAAWCYGGPGVASALWLAGQALDHSGHRELALAALEASLARPPELRRTDSPTFCHGQAGVLTVTAVLARASGRPGFAAAAADLTDGLLDRFDAAAPLGYRDLEAGGRPVDQPALLTGAPGVALALLGATAAADPAWARLFLLA